MRHKLKNQMKQYYLGRTTILLIKKIKLDIFFSVKFNVKKYLRKIGCGDIRCLELKKYKNIHLGERCFVIATGPSLTIDDLKLLKNEYTFGMNSLCKVFDELGWETTYFGVQDYAVYKKIETDLKKLTTSQVFIASRIEEANKEKTDFNIFELHLLNHKVTYNKLKTKFSNDCSQVVFDGYTIAYSLLQLAVYMGFKEIYLIGADCNYSDDVNKQHFIELGVVDAAYKTAGDRLIFAYEYVKKYINKKNVEIYNATRGGKLEVFKRVNLDEVLKEKL